MKVGIRILFLISTFFLIGNSVFSQEKQNLYVDKSTGQVFVEPGTNRVKIEDYTKPSGDISPKETKSNPPFNKKLAVLGRIQFRGMSGSADSPVNNGHRDFNSVDWAFRRLRLGAKYESDLWGALVVIRGENLLNRVGLSQSTSTINYTDPTTGNNTSTTVVTNTSLDNNRGYIHEAVGFMKIPFAKTKFVVGQLNVPFNREYVSSSSSFVSLERSAITAALPQFDNGIMIQTHPLKEINKSWEKYLQISFAISNGKGGGGDYGTGRRQDLTSSTRYGSVNISPMYTGRISWNVLGGLVKDGKESDWNEGHEIFQKDLKISIGTGFTSTRNLIVTPVSAMEYNPGTTHAYNYVHSQGAYSDNGSTTTATVNGVSMTLPNYSVQDGITTPGRPRLGLYARTYDGTLTWKGFYLNGAYTRMIGAASNQLNGWHTTIGYNINILEKYWVMPVLKYDYLNGDFNRNGNRHELVDTLRIYWAGLNFFGDKHDFKVQLYYQVLANHLDMDPNTGNPMPIDDRRVTLQIQTNFSAGTVSPDDINYRSN